VSDASGFNQCVPEMIRKKREVTGIEIAHDHNQAAFTGGIRVTRKHGLHELGCFAVRCICGCILAAHRLQAPEQFEPAWYQIHFAAVLRCLAAV